MEQLSAENGIHISSNSRTLVGSWGRAPQTTVLVFDGDDPKYAIAPRVWGVRAMQQSVSTFIDILNKKYERSPKTLTNASTRAYSTQL